MSLAEMTEHLSRSRQGGTMKTAERARLRSKMKELMARLAKVGKRGGGFAKVRLSDEVKEMYERGRWM